MKKLIVLSLLLTSCTKAEKSLSKIFQDPAPQFSTNNYAAENDTYVEISGICDSEYESFLIKVNGNYEPLEGFLYEPAVPAICVDNKFDIKLSLSSLGVTQNSIKDFSFIQRNSQGEETSASEVKIGYSNSLRAIVTGISNNQSFKALLNFTISGTDITSFKYKIGNVDCLSPAGYSSSITTMTQSLDISGLTEGNNKLCVLGGNATGYQYHLDATMVDFIFDKTAPQNIQITIKPTIYSKETTATFKVETDDPTAIYYYKHSLTSCLAETSFIESTQNVSLSLGGTYLNKVNYFCVYAQDAATNKSNIIEYSWTHDNTVPPDVTTSGLSYNLSSDKTTSPNINATYTQDSGSPYTHLIIKVEKTDASFSTEKTIALPYTGSLFVNGLSLTDGSYRTYIKMKDTAGNESSYVLTGTWHLDATGPTVAASLVSTPYSLTGSTVLNSTFSDANGISAATATFLDNTDSLIAGPISISSGTNFSFTSLVLTRDSYYKIKVTVYDNYNNVTNYVHTYKTANCVTSNPNNIHVKAGICTGVTGAAALGWKMQGGIVIGVDTSISTKIIVLPENPMENSANVDWGLSQTSNYYLDSVNQNDNSDPDSKTLTLGAYGHCSNLEVQEYTDWFLPNMNQMTKIFCHSTLSTLASSSIPDKDVNCTSSGKSTTISLSDVAYWTQTEKSATEAYFMQSGDFDYYAKTQQMTAICVRRFLKIY